MSLESQIGGIIPQSNTEAVLFRIGEILEIELTNQRNLMSPTDALLNAKVWMERVVPFSESELPAINVCFVKLPFESKDAKSAMGVSSFSIEFWDKAPTTNEKRGDATARSNVQRLAFIARAILENPIYKRLAFAPPSLSGTWVGAITMPDKVQDIQLNNSTVCAMEFNVKLTEGVALKTPTLLAGNTTVVKLHTTELGYVWGADSSFEHIEEATSMHLRNLTVTDANAPADGDGNRFFFTDDLPNNAIVKEPIFINDGGGIHWKNKGITRNANTKVWDFTAIGGLSLADPISILYETY